MKKEIKEIMDGASPEELQRFEKDIPEEAELPSGVSAETISAKAKEKAGIASAKSAKVLKPVSRKRKVRAFVLIAACIALAAIVTGAVSIALNRANSKEPGNGYTDTPTGSNGYNDGVIGGGTAENGSSLGLLDKITGMLSPSRGDATAEGSFSYSGGYIAEASGEMLPSEDPVAPGQNGISAGTLTSKEWKDATLANFSAWKTKLNDNEWYSLAKQHNINAGHAIPVHVTSKDAAVYNAKVELLSGGKTIFTGKTGVDGYVFLFYGIDGNKAVPDSIKIGDTVTKLEAVEDGKAVEIALADGAVEAKALDLMLMIDTTGSMGDELEYLKVELADMVERIAKTNETLSIRVSVNFYRDEGDEYIVKYYDFRSDIAECVSQIGSQRASGGGDYPEAVHTALDNAVNGHQWRNEAVKLCFLVLDAPSHDGEAIDASLRATLDSAAAQGIRIIPVASSGVDTNTEFLLRSFAAITGGTYIFLTNDSGIGGDHKDAEVGEADVEALNECMIRVVCEYIGQKYVKPAIQQGNVQ